MNKKLLWVLIAFVVVANPFDISVFVNRTFGWSNHFILWGIVIIILFFIIPGNSIMQKLNYIRSQVRDIL